MRTFTLLLLILSLNLFAEQVEFSKRERESSIALQYLWLDHQDVTRQIGFALDKDSTQSQFRNKKNYQPEIAQRHVYVALMKSAQKINPKEARVKIVNRGSRFDIQVSARTSEIVNQYQNLFSERQEIAFDDYLRENYYVRFENHMGKKGVIPDHVRYINESRDVVLPIAQALYDLLEEGSNTRDYINLLLSWVQSIPYDTLENRLVSNGAGFYPPVDVITNNLGDCDSKVTLTAALLRALLPGLSIEIVYLPEHAMLAANLGVRSGETSIDVRGAPHVIIEPTGPAKLLVGQTDQRSARAIANGTYTTVNVP